MVRDNVQKVRRSKGIGGGKYEVVKRENKIDTTVLITCHLGS
jgi:hypothetical protein